MELMRQVTGQRDLLAVLNQARSVPFTSRADVGRRLDLGRSVVAQRVETLVALGLLEEGGPGSPAGGRAPRRLRFRGNAGFVVVGELGASGLSVGLCDLAGNVLVSAVHSVNVATGPEAVLDGVMAAWTKLLERHGVDSNRVWAAGLGIPGPVEFITGRPIAPPIMPGWDGYPVRERLSAALNVPVWVDNEVNLRALGEARHGLGRGFDDMIFVKIGTGIGAGIISEGALHRGANGAAGDIGHIAVVDDASIVCRCGNTGCLEAVAGGEAIGQAGRLRAGDRQSTALAELATTSEALTPKDVLVAASAGDPIALDILVNAARIIGETLAMLVNFHNPGLLILGGAIVQESDLMLSSIRETIYRRSLPLATRTLVIGRSGLRQEGALSGATEMVVDELFRPALFNEWVADGSPHGNPNIARVA